MKKILSLTVSLALFAGLGAMPAGAAEQPGSGSAKLQDAKGIIFDIDFDDASLSPNVGAATEGTNKGIYVASYDGTLAYQFNSSYFKPTAEDGTPLLTGLEEFTVSYWAKTDSSTRNWTLFAAPDTNTQTYQQEKYIGVRDNGTEILIERYNNNGSRPSTLEVKSLDYGWKHIVMVQKAGSYELYINGKLSKSQTSSYSVSGILGNSSIIQVGKGNWEKGEYASGLIDNYRIYNYALDEAEISDLYNDELTPVIKWDTATDSMKTGTGDEATGTLRFLASVKDDCGFDISGGEYGFVFVNFEPDTVINDHMGEAGSFTGKIPENVRYLMESIAPSGLQTNKTFFIDIENIPLSATKMGFYAVPYIALENGFIIYGPAFTASKFSWVNE